MRGPGMLCVDICSSWYESDWVCAPHRVCESCRIERNVFMIKTFTSDGQEDPMPKMLHYCTMRKEAVKYPEVYEHLELWAQIWRPISSTLMPQCLLLVSWKRVFLWLLFLWAVYLYILLFYFILLFWMSSYRYIWGREDSDWHRF